MFEKMAQEAGTGNFHKHIESLTCLLFLFFTSLHMILKEVKNSTSLNLCGPLLQKHTIIVFLVSNFNSRLRHFVIYK